jgi:flagellar basal-body rod modification protein FlgD
MRIDSLPSDLTTPSTGGSAPAAGADQGASKNEFLKLLVAQLEHQDPLSPQDGADFVAQLAQFSSLEQATETNQRLSALADAQAANQRAALTDLVGRNVTASAGSVQVDPSKGDLPNMRVHFAGATSGADVVIKDSAGHEVRHIHMGAHGAGDAPLGWDGKGDSGQPLPAGAFTIEVAAKGAGGGSVDAQAQITGRIGSVKFADGSTTFTIGSAVIQPGSIVSVDQ